MTEVSAWRARGYWTLAAVVVPLVNPVVLALAVYRGDDNPGRPWLPVLLLIAVANFVVLRLVGGRVWRQPEMRRWRAAFGAGLAIALSFVYGALELYALIWISCSGGGCFN